MPRLCNDQFLIIRLSLEYQDNGHHLLVQKVKIRYGRSDWICEDLDPRPGENSVGGVFIKEDCVKNLEDKVIHTYTTFFRKPGQDGLDDQGNYKPGDFESMTRFEIFAPGVTFQ